MPCSVGGVCHMSYVICHTGGVQQRGKVSPGVGGRQVVK
jgi:hypothetical protein